MAFSWNKFTNSLAISCSKFLNLSFNQSSFIGLILYFNCQTFEVHMKHIPKWHIAIYVKTTSRVFKWWYEETQKYFSSLPPNGLRWCRKYKFNLLVLQIVKYNSNWSFSRCLSKNKLHLICMFKVEEWTSSQRDKGAIYSKIQKIQDEHNII